MFDNKKKHPPSEAEIREHLKNVIDPEFGVDIVNLGLIYDILINDKKVEVHFTLTNPACPLEEQFRREITAQITSNFDIDELTVKIVWFPRWDPDFMTEEARFMTGLPI